MGKSYGSMGPTGLMHECIAKPLLNLVSQFTLTAKAPTTSVYLGAPTYQIPLPSLSFVMCSSSEPSPNVLIFHRSPKHAVLHCPTLTIIHPPFFCFFYSPSCLPPELVYRQESRPSVSMRNDSELCCRHEQTGSPCQVSSQIHLKTRFGQA